MLSTQGYHSTLAIHHHHHNNIRHLHRPHPYADYRTWNHDGGGLGGGGGGGMDDGGDDGGSGGNDNMSDLPYSAGVFHLQQQQQQQVPSPYSHYNPLVQQVQQVQSCARPLSAGSGNQHIYMEVDPR